MTTEAPTGWRIRELVLEVDDDHCYRIVCSDRGITACASYVCKRTGIVEYLRTADAKSISFDDVDQAAEACRVHRENECTARARLQAELGARQ